MAFDPDAKWPELRSLAERGEYQTLLSLIKGIESDADRVSLYRSTIRHLAFDEWNNKNLDAMIEVADAAIEECELLGGDYLEQANVICFNTSANLADCWGDDLERELRHFEKGHHYAQKAAWYRDHLGKGPGSKSMAEWALGKHCQSLGRTQEAIHHYRRSLDYSAQEAVEEGKSAAISAEAPSGYLIAAGYVALLSEDRPTLDQLASVLREMVQSGGEANDDAKIIAVQLVNTARKMGKDLDFGFEGPRA